VTRFNDPDLTPATSRLSPTPNALTRESPSPWPAATVGAASTSAVDPSSSLLDKESAPLDGSSNVPSASSAMLDRSSDVLSASS
jgi:hypothetical protein